MQFDIIIIGAGASGLMCASRLGYKNKKVLLLDHSSKLAEKIRISGGGRCNFTNIYSKPEAFISNTPKFCISALSRYTPKDFMQLLSKHNIQYHHKTLGQLFCNDSSQQIIDMLDFMCNESNNVLRIMNVKIEHIEYNDKYIITTFDNKTYTSECLVIATGGLSIPQIGASPFGYKIAEQFGINIIPPKPALVPLTLDPKDLDNISQLAGTSFLSETSILGSKIKFLENSLLTHRGLSGPAILQISSYWDNGKELTINLLPTILIKEHIIHHKTSNQKLSTFLSQFFSSRFANNIVGLIGIDKTLSQLSNKDIEKINQFIHNFKIKPNGTLGYKKAEVTKGGIDCKELSSKNMMSNKQSGLFFIGEIVDVTGWLGGYNFQWAWSSAISMADNI
jgi:predicted Rossmann fold flavoprotein